MENEHWLKPIPKKKPASKQQNEKYQQFRVDYRCGRVEAGKFFERRKICAPAEFRLYTMVSVMSAAVAIVLRMYYVTLQPPRYTALSALYVCVLVLYEHNKDWRGTKREKKPLDGE